MIIVCNNFFNSTWKSFLIRIPNLQISQNKSIIWKIHYVENIFFVAEVNEDQSLIVYGASLFYWTWKSKLQTLVLQNYQNFFQKKSAILKICHIENIFCIRSSWRWKLNYLWCFSFLQNIKIMSNSKVIGLFVYRISQNFRKNPVFLKSTILRVPHTFTRDMVA